MIIMYRIYTGEDVFGLCHREDIFLGRRGWCRRWSDGGWKDAGRETYLCLDPSAGEGKILAPWELTKWK